MPGGHGGHGREIGCRRAAPGREKSRRSFLFRQYESAELPGRDLVIHRAVRGLHGQQPVHFPFHLRQEIGQLAARFGNIQADLLDSRAEILPCPEHAPHRHSGVDRVFVVIAGVVPALRAVLLHVLAGDGIQPGVFQVACLVAEGVAVVCAFYGRAAAPQVHAPHDRVKRPVEHVAGHAERRPIFPRRPRPKHTRPAL